MQRGCTLRWDPHCNGNLKGLYIFKTGGSVKYCTIKNDVYLLCCYFSVSQCEALLGRPNEGLIDSWSHATEPIPRPVSYVETLFFKRTKRKCYSSAAGWCAPKQSKFIFWSWWQSELSRAKQLTDRCWSTVEGSFIIVSLQRRMPVAEAARGLCHRPIPSGSDWETSQQQAFSPMHYIDWD